MAMNHTGLVAIKNFLPVSVAGANQTLTQKIVEEKDLLSRSKYSGNRGRDVRYKNDKKIKYKYRH